MKKSFLAGTLSVVILAAVLAAGCTFPTAWLGFNASARTGAAIEYGTSPLMPYYTMVITGSAVGQTPFQQAMWQHMWDVVHSQNGNGGGMGVYMGVGMNATMRNAMQQEMQEHVGSGFSPDMTGKLA